MDRLTSDDKLREIADSLYLPPSGRLLVIAALRQARDLGRSEKHECSFSTGIDGSITAGSGALDNNGYWERPCEPCTAWANKCEQALDMGREERNAEIERLTALLERGHSDLCAVIERLEKAS